jgi:hypothetical protein
VWFSTFQNAFLVDGEKSDFGPEFRLELYDGPVQEAFKTPRPRSDATKKVVEV